MSYLLSTLREALPERHKLAVQGLRDGSLTITLTRQNDAEIRALHWSDLVCQPCVQTWLNPSQGKAVAL